MAIEEGQSSGNLNAQVSGYDLFVFPQFYVVLFLFVSVALSCRFNSCVIPISVGLFSCFRRYLLLCLSSAYMPLFYSSVVVSVHLFICFDSYIMFGAVTDNYITCYALLFDMFNGSWLHVIIMIHVIFIFISNIIYVIIILLIYGIKMTWKLSNNLTKSCRNFIEISSISLEKRRNKDFSPHPKHALMVVFHFITEFGIFF